MPIEQMVWDEARDWEKGTFNGTNAWSPGGALVLGLSQRNSGTERFAYFFNTGSGTSVVNKFDQLENATISGAHSWERTPSGQYFLRLSGGMITIPGNSSWPLATHFVGITFRISEYPTSEMELIGQNDTSSKLRVFLCPDGKLKIGDGEKSGDTVPKDTINLVLLAIVVDEGKIVGGQLFLNGQKAGVLSGGILGHKITTGYRIGPGKIDVYNAWMVESIKNQEDAIPTTQGTWESEPFNLESNRRLTAISIDGYIKDAHQISVTVVMGEDKYFTNLKFSQAKFSKPTSYILKNLVNGVYGKVLVAIKTISPDSTPVINRLALYFSDYPFAAPIYLPVLPKPEEQVQAFGVPAQEDLLIKAEKTSSPERINIFAEEGKITVSTDNAEFSRVIRPRKGWPQFCGLSTRLSFSQYEISPPLWLMGKLKCPTKIIGQPIIDEKGRIIGRNGRCFFAWDGWGKELWMRYDPYDSIADGTIINERLVWPTTIDVRCLDVRDGSLLWTYVPETNPSGVLATLENGYILIPLENGKLDLITEKGELIKQIDTGLSTGTHIDEAYVDIPYSESYHVDSPAKYTPHEDHSNYDDYSDFYQLSGWYDKIPCRGGQTIEFGRPYLDCVRNPEKCRRNVSSHSDTPHADTAHGDQGHNDSVHADIPYKDVTVEEKHGKGVKFTDEGLFDEILLVFPAFACIVNQDSEIISLISEGSRLTAATLCDEIAAEGDTSTIRLVHAGFEDGTVRTYQADSGVALYERDLESGAVKFIFAAPLKGVPIVVGCQRALFLLSQDLESIWKIDLDEEPAGWPVLAGQFFVVPLKTRVWIIRYDGIIVNELITEEEITGSPVVMKNNTLLVPCDTGILVFASNRTPFISYELWPEFAHSKEEFYLIDRSTEIFGEIKDVRWFVKGEMLTGKVVKTKIENPGTYEIIHIATNDIGQRSEENIRLRVYPSFVEERPVLWSVESQITRRMSIAMKSEDEMRIFYPDEGINEVYQDQPVRIDLKIFGDYMNLTGSTIKFVVKDSESVDAEELLSINGELVVPEDGYAKVEVTPDDWKRLEGDKPYYWGIYITYPSGRVELAARGRVELRAALA